MLCDRVQAIRGTTTRETFYAHPWAAKSPGPIVVAGSGAVLSMEIEMSRKVKQWTEGTRLERAARYTRMRDFLEEVGRDLTAMGEGAEATQLHLAARCMAGAGARAISREQLLAVASCCFLANAGIRCDCAVEAPAVAT